MWCAKTRAAYRIRCDRIDERSAAISEWVTLFLVFSTLQILIAAAPARAQMGPATVEADATSMVAMPAPQPSTGFCVDSRTGAIRMQLTLNGMVQSCKRLELGVDL
jgi:hypothetical protein